MSLKVRGLPFLSYSLVVLGVALGIFGSVKVGALLIALGTAGVSLAGESTSVVGRYLPLALALSLFALALALPGR